MPRERREWWPHKRQSTDAGHRGGTPRSSAEAPVMGVERRGCIVQLSGLVNQRWEEPVQTAKPFSISKRMVWDAYTRVKANQGAAGVDEESLADFEENLTDNLCKLWNRRSEEHTSELQSPDQLVCRLLLEKEK